MRSVFHNILIVLIFGITSLQAYPLNLPVKRVNGTDYYYYNVERRESLADIAKKFGITRDDILRTNPSAADGIRIGSVLYFPVKDFAEDDLNLPGQSTGQTGDGSPTRYKVQKGETLYGISMRFGVTPDDIVALNPQTDTGVKAGQILLIPQIGSKDANMVSQTSNPPTVPSVIPPEPDDSYQPESQQPLVPDDMRNLRPVELPAPVVIDSINNNEYIRLQPQENRLRPVELPAPIVIDSISADTASETRPTNVALLLPLMLNDLSDNKRGRNSADFVRGFMLGVKSLSHEAYACNINVYDTQANEAIIAEILNDTAVQDAKIIVANNEGADGTLFPDFAGQHEAYVLNLFASHDTTYLTSPWFIQANTPAQTMYEKAAQALRTAYDGYTPVFLIAKGGRGEKMPFTSYVKSLYEEAGIEPIEMIYEGMLTSADIDNLDPGSKYVFIPSSGALSEFNKFAHTLIAWLDLVDDPSAVALFGYPDWTTFRNESLDCLHRMNAMIYSRFYSDDKDDATRRFNELFERTYGSSPLGQVPSQALLGYDTARYILNNINNNEGEYVPEAVPFRGIQSTFMFTDASGNDSVDDDEAGYVNNSLYIITYLPGERVRVQVL